MSGQLDQKILDGLAQGMVLDEVPVTTINQEQLKTYAAASGDYNPIHQNDEVAKKAGLPGVIAHGMLIAGMMNERARIWLKSNVSASEYIRWTVISSQTRFRGMTFLGDTVFVGGMVTLATESTAWIELTAKNQKGETLTTGVLKLKLRD